MVGGVSSPPTLMKKSLVDKILERVKYWYNWAKNRDWSNPRVILTLIACIVIPFAAWQYVATGLVLGLIKAISVLWIIEKAPLYIKELIVEHPLITDITLNALLLIVFGGYFGSGLMLGFAAVFSMMFVSWSLPEFAKKVKREREEFDKNNHHEDDISDNETTNFAGSPGSI
jgi:hypothetical protein